jgi:hypothetical protein
MSGSASAASIGTGMLGGAGTGMMIGGPYGAAAGAVIGGVLSALGGDGGAAAQQKISQDALQNSINQEAYARGLNAEALRRAVAGSIDAQGSTIRYDPSTNTWVSALGKEPSGQQAALNSAAIMHNSTDVAQSVQNNAASSIQASLARRGLSGAMNTLESYQPKSQAEVEGALQDSSTRANQISQGPIIADTLRQFARTGTAAGPVLAQLERANSDTLSKEMSDNTVKAMTGTGAINDANQRALSTPIQTLLAAGTPNQQNTNVQYTPGPAAELAAQVNGRATGSSTPASAGSGSSAYGTIAANQAAKLASDTSMNSPLPGQLAGANQSIQNLAKQINGGNGSSFGSGITDFFNRNFNGVGASNNPNVASNFGNEQILGAGGFT